MARNKFRDGSNSGPSQRQLRVNELIRRQLSDVLMRGDVHDPDLNRMSITVGEVSVSPDLKVATAYVVPLGGQNTEEMFELLKRNKGELRRAVSKGLTLKFAPELRFRLDETFDQLDDTRRLFSDEKVQRDVALKDEDDGEDE
jgi:ribosome-binding factor A